MSRDELDSAAVARIARRVRERGPGIVRRARFVRRARPFAAAALAVIAVLLLVDRERPPPPLADARACASWSAVEVEQSGRFDLGPRGFANAAEGEARIVSRDPCTTELELVRGRIVVLARDLGNGELRVRSGEDVVVAKGTLFAVERQEAGIAVEVAEGRVELMATEPIRIDAGERVLREQGSIARAALTEARKESMLIAVGLLAERPPIETPEPRKERRRVKKPKPRVVPPPVQSPEQLLLEGHEARKQGDVDRARELFTRAGRELESAWMSLARMELDASRADAAIAALDERQRRYGEGALAIEAAWLRVRALDARRDRTGAAAEAKRILERWPKSPYADSAKRWLEDR